MSREKEWDRWEPHQHHQNQGGGGGGDGGGRPLGMIEEGILRGMASEVGFLLFLAFGLLFFTYILNGLQKYFSGQEEKKKPRIEFTPMYNVDSGIPPGASISMSIPTDADASIFFKLPEKDDAMAKFDVVDRKENRVITYVQHFRPIPRLVSTPIEDINQYVPSPSDRPRPKPDPGYDEIDNAKGNGFFPRVRDPDTPAPRDYPSLRHPSNYSNTNRSSGGSGNLGRLPPSSISNYAHQSNEMSPFFSYLNSARVPRPTEVEGTVPRARTNAPSISEEQQERINNTLPQHPKGSYQFESKSYGYD